MQTTSRVLVGAIIGAVIIGIWFLAPTVVPAKTVGDFYNHYCTPQADLNNCLVQAEDAWRTYNSH